MTKKEMECFRVGRLPCCEVLVTSNKHSLNCPTGESFIPASVRKQNMQRARRLNPRLKFV